MNAKEKEREGKFAEFQAVTRESAFLAESLKIDGMDALMDRVNRLKTPTIEFEKMRDAVSALKTTYLQIANKIVSKETVLETDYKNYQEGEIGSRMVDGANNFIKYIGKIRYVRLL